MSVLLKVDNLKTWFKMDRGLVKAVDGMSYHINEGEIIGLVGETLTLPFPFVNSYLFTGKS